MLESGRNPFSTPRFGELVSRITLLGALLVAFACDLGEVAGAPVILSQPVDRSTAEGTIITLSVTADGEPPLSYQWYVGRDQTPGFSRPMQGATNSTYTPSGLTMTSSWWVRVTDATGSVDSRVATIEVVKTVAFERVASWPGFRSKSAQSIHVAGDYAYVLAGAIQVFDLSDPLQPVRVGAYDPGGELRALEVAEGVGYCVGSEGVEIIDLREPTSPTPLSRVTLWGAIDVSLVEQRAYVACQSLGLSILDVADPSRPVLLSTYQDGSYIDSVKVSGHHAYFADGSLKVIDVSNPANPVRVAELPELRGRVDASGDYAYVAGAQALTIVRIEDPTQPEVVGVLRQGLRPESIQVLGNVAFICGTEPALTLVDVSNPALPRKVSDYWDIRMSYALSLKGTYAYLAGAIEGLDILDIADPTSPRSLGKANTYSTLWDVKVSGHHAYVTETSTGTGFWIMDITDPTRPEPKGHHEGYVADVRQGFVYALTDHINLQIVDARDPARPVVAGRYRSRGATTSVDVNGRHAYLAAGAAGLLVLDVSNPTSPTELGRTYTGSWASYVRVQDERAYVCDGSGSFSVLDVSNPASPQKLASYGPIAGCHVVSVLGPIAYVSTTDFWTLILDMSDLNQLMPINRLSVSRALPIGELAFAKQYGSGYAELQVLDMRHLVQPVQVGEYRNPGGIQGYDVRDRFVFLTTGDSLEVHFLSGGPPVITEQPRDVATILEGAPPVLTVKALGEPLSYQWYHGSSGDTNKPISGATHSSLALTPFTPVRHYWVRVGNRFGSLESRTATVTVHPILRSVEQSTQDGPRLSLEIVAPPGIRCGLQHSPNMSFWEDLPSVAPIFMRTSRERVSIASPPPMGFFRAVWIP